MALPTPALTFSAITSDRLTGTITDGSVYTSPARTAIGVFLSGDKMTHESIVDEVLTITGNDNDPETDNSWTFNIPKDGWVRFLFVAVPDYDAGATYALYDATFDPTTNGAYRSKQAGNIGNALTDTSYWEAITLPASLALNEGEANESANIESAVYQIIPLPTSEYAFANAIALASTEGGDAEREQSVQLYELMAVLVDGAYIRSDRSEFSQGEKIARRIQSTATEEGLI